MAPERISSDIPLPDKPDIVGFGNVMDEVTIEYMQRAADELNVTLERPKFRLVVDADSHFDIDGTLLAEGWQRVRLLGSLTESDVAELWARADEIEQEDIQNNSVA